MPAKLVLSVFWSCSILKNIILNPQCPLTFVLGYEKIFTIKRNRLDHVAGPQKLRVLNNVFEFNIYLFSFLAYKIISKNNVVYFDVVLILTYQG